MDGTNDFEHFQNLSHVTVRRPRRVQLESTTDEPSDLSPALVFSPELESEGDEGIDDFTAMLNAQISQWSAGQKTNDFFEFKARNFKKLGLDKLGHVEEITNYKADTPSHQEPAQKQEPEVKAQEATAAPLEMEKWLEQVKEIAVALQITAKSKKYPWLKRGSCCGFKKDVEELKKHLNCINLNLKRMGL